MKRVFAVIGLLLLASIAYATPPVGPISRDCTNAYVSGDSYSLSCGGAVNYQETSGSWAATDLSASETPITQGFTHYFSKGRYRMEIDSVNGIIRIYPDRTSDNKYLEIRGHPVNPVEVDVEVINNHRVKVSKSTANVDYEFFITDRGLKVGFNIKNDSAPDTFTLGLRLVGLSRTGRNIFDGDKRVGVLPNPDMIDANGVIRSVAEVVEEASDSVYLTADYSGLTFPIYIDPSLSLQPTNADASFYEDNVNTTANGTELEVRRHDAGAERRSPLRWDFSSLPSGATITDATITMWIKASGSGGPFSLDMARLTTTTWTEAGVTWNCAQDDNHDGSCDIDWTSDGGDYTDTDKGNNASVNCSTAGTPFTWDVTTLTQWFQSNASEVADFLFKFTSAGSSQLCVWRSNTNSTTAERPRIVITYVPAGVRGTNIVDGLGGGSAVGTGVF